MTFHMIQTGQSRLRVKVEGEGPLVLMVHGFPESWYSWRHQIGPIAAAGFKAAAIDVRGYGQSQKFPHVRDYGMDHMINDIIGVGDALSPGKAFTLIGHDWGAPMVWNSALTRPDRIAAVGAMSVPFFGVPEFSFDDVIKRVFDDRNIFFYQSYFRVPGHAEARIEKDPRRFLLNFYYAISGEAPPGTFPQGKPSDFDLAAGMTDPPRLPDWLNEADLSYYEQEFLGSGFFGPLSRYRNHTPDFDFLKTFHGRKIEQPAFFIAGDKDPAYTGFGMVEDPVGRMRTAVPNLEAAHELKACGHWTQQEKPGEVNAALMPWLKSLKGRVI